jgi:hypothetical protein
MVELTPASKRRRLNDNINYLEGYQLQKESPSLEAPDLTDTEPHEGLASVGQYDYGRSRAGADGELTTPYAANVLNHKATECCFGMVRECFEIGQFILVCNLKSVDDFGLST